MSTSTIPSVQFPHNLACPRCGGTEFETRPKGQHLGAYCAKPTCNAWCCWLKQNRAVRTAPALRQPAEVPTEPGSTVLDFGKYAGRHIRDVPDGYLKWLLNDCHTLDPNIESVIHAELYRRGERYVPASVVLAEIENDLSAAINNDDAITHTMAALFSDHVLDVIDSIRRRHGIGEQTEMLIPAQKVRSETAPLPTYRD